MAIAMSMTMMAMTMTLALPIRAPRRSRSIEHALLVRGQLGVERFDRISTHLHFRLTLLCPSLHLVQTLRRCQLTHFFAQSLAIHFLRDTPLRRIDKGIPGGFLLRLQI